MYRGSSFNFLKATQTSHSQEIRGYPLPEEPPHLLHPQEGRTISSSKGKHGGLSPTKSDVYYIPPTGIPDVE